MCNISMEDTQIWLALVIKTKMVPKNQNESYLCVFHINITRIQLTVIHFALYDWRKKTLGFACVRHQTSIHSNF